MSVRCDRWFTSINHQHHLHLYICVVSKGPGHWEFPQWFEPQGDVLAVCTGEECGLSAGATARTDGGRELRPRQHGQERWKGLHRRQQSLTLEYQIFAFTTTETINMEINTSAYFWFCIAELNITHLWSHFNLWISVGTLIIQPYSVQVRSILKILLNIIFHKYQVFCFTVCVTDCVICSH